MLNYTSTIFAQSGSSLSPNLSSIIVAGVQIFGSLCSVLLVERTGRKFLLIISLLGCAFGVSTLGSYTYLKGLEGFEFLSTDSFKWIPLVSFSFVMFISNWGYMTIMFLYIAEVTPQKVSFDIK
jgi:SP family facilitated glucose transporter-like MFS transporter 8